MLAIRVHEFGPPEVLKLEKAPKPSPKAGQALVKIMAAGVNPVDAYIRSGLFYKKDLPYTPGTDAAGIVEAIGEGVVEIAPGDRGYTSGSLTGTYAGFALCKAAHLHRRPARP